MVKTVVVLGGGLSAIPIAHHLLKHTAPLVPDLKVVLVSPNSDFFWNFASVRGILPDKFGDDKLFYPIADAFAKYPKSNFEHVLGLAEALDPDHKTVTVLLNGGKEQRRTIDYNTVVVATGSSTRADMPWKNLATTEETKASLAQWRKRIASADTIVVGGAGETGVEVTGELAAAYGKGKKNKKKNIILVASDDLPLGAHLRRDVRQTVKSELENMGARVITGSRVTTEPGAELGADGLQTLEVAALTTGKTEKIERALYVPTHGVEPNTAFAPAKMVGADGRLRQTAYLRAEGYEDVFVVGDCGDLETSTGAHAENQIVHVADSLKAFLTGNRAGVTEYKPDPKIMTAVTLGDSKGTGQFGGWKLFSFLVWFAKGRHIGTNYAGDLVQGNRTIMKKSW